MDCQLWTLSDAGRELTRLESMGSRVIRILRYSYFAGVKVLKRPSIVARKFHELAQHRRHRNGAGTSASGAQPVELPVLHLEPGERVRVKEFHEIERTLDSAGRYEGLTYIEPVMNRYCGLEFTVRKRVDRFFDEKRWKMLKARDVVLLDGAFCEPSADVSADWAGCSRTCFLFWKEAWLERA